MCPILLDLPHVYLVPGAFVSTERVGMLHRERRSRHSGRIYLPSRNLWIFVVCIFKLVQGSIRLHCKRGFFWVSYHDLFLLDASSSIVAAGIGLVRATDGSRLHLKLIGDHEHVLGKELACRVGTEGVLVIDNDQRWMVEHGCFGFILR